MTVAITVVVAVPVALSLVMGMSVVMLIVFMAVSVPTISMVVIMPTVVSMSMIVAMDVGRINFGQRVFAPLVKCIRHASLGSPIHGDTRFLQSGDCAAPDVTSDDDVSIRLGDSNWWWTRVPAASPGVLKEIGFVRVRIVQGETVGSTEVR